MEIYKKNFSYREKDNKEGPVTEADYASNRIICEGLKKEFPDHWICSEEIADDSERVKSEKVFCIDPLDGTKDFLLKNGEFAVHIGLIIGHKPVMGVVYLPAYNKLLYGGRDLVSYLEYNGHTVKLKANHETDVHNMILAGSRSHRAESYRNLIAKINPKKEIIHGSMGAKAAFIAEGKADLFIYPGSTTKEWDICAPQAILEGCGAKVTDIYGNPLLYNKEKLNNQNGILASNGANHEGLVTLISEITKKAN